MPAGGHQPIALKRDCEGTLIPSGDKVTLPRGDLVEVTQALGGSFTVRTGVGYLVASRPTTPTLSAWRTSCRRKRRRPMRRRSIWKRSSGA